MSGFGIDMDCLGSRNGYMLPRSRDVRNMTEDCKHHVLLVLVSIKVLQAIRPLSVVPVTWEDAEMAASKNGR